MKNSICLTMIVKNESKTITRLIDSCKGFISSYCIVDTGSTDNTIEVIKRAMGDIPGAIHERLWVNFGFNRSEALELAKGLAEYLFVVDADEELVIVDNKAFNELELVADSYYVKYAGGFDYSRTFIVKSDKNWRYIGYVHEYIHSDIAVTAEDLSCIEIKHHADSGSSENRSTKIKRDILLLRKSIEEEPKDHRNYFYLAQTYYDDGQYDQSLKFYKKRIKLEGWVEEVYYSMYKCGMCYYNMKKIDDAVVHLLNAFSYRPSRFEALYMLGFIHREKCNFHTAILFYNKICSMKYPKDRLFIHKSEWAYMSHFELGICYWWIGEYERSVYYCDRVSEANNVPENVINQNLKNRQFALDKL